MQMHNAELVEQLVNERMAAFKKELFSSVFAEEEKNEEDWRTIYLVPLQKILSNDTIE